MQHAVWALSSLLLFAAVDEEMKPYAAAKPVAQSTVMPSMSLKPAVVRLEGQNLVLSGVIDADANRRFERALAGNPHVKQLSLSSAGGDTIAVMALGRSIHQRQMNIEINGACTSLCSFYLVPAAANVSVKDGSYLILTQVPTPQFRAVAMEGLRLKAGNSQSARARLQQADNALKATVIAQDRYFQDIAVDPRRMDIVMDVWLNLLREVQAAGKGQRDLGFVPSPSFVSKCLGLSRVNLPTYTASDSAQLASFSKGRVGLQIGASLFFDGTAIKSDPLTCLS